MVLQVAPQHTTAAIRVAVSSIVRRPRSEGLSSRVAGAPMPAGASRRISPINESPCGPGVSRALPAASSSAAVSLPVSPGRAVEGRVSLSKRMSSSETRDNRVPAFRTSGGLPPPLPESLPPLSESLPPLSESLPMRDQAWSHE